MATRNILKPIVQLVAVYLSASNIVKSLIHLIKSYFILFSFNNQLPLRLV